MAAVAEGEELDAGLTAELPADPPADPWSQVIGQTRAQQQLRQSVTNPLHAYLFVGPEGVGKRELARIFAAAILSDNFSAPDSQTVLRLARTEQLVDMDVIEPEGRAFLVADAQRVIQSAGRPPIQRQRKVIIVDRFHAANPEVAPSLLKTIEEPPAAVVLVILSEHIPAEHETIASRCVKIGFAPLSDGDIFDWLTAGGELAMDERQAGLVAGASLGSQKRARLLAGDEGFAARLGFWQQAPARCGTAGAQAVALTDELADLLEQAQLPLTEAQARQVAEAADAAAVAKSGELTAGQKKAMETRHRRELRQFKEDELRWGFSVLAQSYWQQMRSDLAGGGRGTDAGRSAEVCEEAVARLRDVQDEMVRNPNETLMLQNLFRHLPHLAASPVSSNKLN